MSSWVSYLTYLPLLNRYLPTSQGCCEAALVIKVLLAPGLKVLQECENKSSSIPCDPIGPAVCYYFLCHFDCLNHLSDTERPNNAFHAHERVTLPVL